MSTFYGEVEAKGPEEEDLKLYESHFTSGRNWLKEHHLDIESNKKFAFEDQWEEGEKTRRQMDPANPRPMVTFNKVLRIGKRLVNDVEVAKLGIKVVPVDNGADPLIAEVYNTYIKKIENDSKAKSVRKQGFEDAVFSNYGFYRVITEWENERSMKKKITLKRIVDNRTVLFPESSIEPDLSDAEWFVIYQRLQDEEAKASYPDVDFSQRPPDGTELCWGDDKAKIIAEHFYLKYTKATLVRLDDDTVLRSMQLPDDVKEFWRSLSTGIKDVVKFEDELDNTEALLWSKLPNEFKKLHSRPSHKKVWYWCKMAGRQIIQKQPWDGTIAPIIFCSSREYWKGGKRNWMCVTKTLRDPQTLYNFYRSTQQERLTMAADAPWLLTAEHIAGYEDLWKTAHLKPLRYLLYNLKHNGETLDQPVRNPPIVGDPGLDMEVQRLDSEILDIAGINLASFGESSGERTGKAILVRQRQGELVNADYAEGGYISPMIREGQIYLDLIPKVYSWEQAIRLMGEEKRKLVEALQNKGILGWGNGRYDLEIEIGSVSNTQREDETTFWKDLIQSNPNIAPLVMDKLVEVIGNKHAKLLAKRFQVMMPPEVRNISEDGTGEFDETAFEVNRVKQEAQQQMQMFQQQVQGQLQQGEQAMQENQQLKLNLQNKSEETRIKLRELELKELELALKADELKLKNGNDQAKIELEYDKLKVQIAQSNRDRKPDSGDSGSKSGSARA